MSNTHSLLDLKIGQCAYISHISDDSLRLFFYELGLMPSTRLRICWEIPWLSVLCIEASNEQIAIRRQEAQHIIVQAL